MEKEPVDVKMLLEIIGEQFVAIKLKDIRIHGLSKEIELLSKRIKKAESDNKKMKTKTEQKTEESSGG